MAKKILILGGGMGGTIVANIVARGLKQEIRNGDVNLTQLSASDKHMYRPGLLYVVFGRMGETDLYRDQRSILDPGVRFFVDPAVNIDTNKQKVTTQSGREYSYDYLVIATGSRIMPELVPGLKEGGHWFYDIDGAKKLRDALKNFTGGKIAISVGVPHKCPVAPLEITFMLHDYIAKKGLADKTEITYTYPIGRVHSLEPVAYWAAPEFEKKGIRYETFFNMETIDPGKKSVTSMEGSTVDYDLLIAIPPHKGQQAIIDSGLNKDGWIPTDRHRLTCEGMTNVFVVGDTTNLPISKAGSTAHYEAEVVADNLISEIRDGMAAKTYDGKVFCFVETAMDKGTYVWFNYTTPPNPAPPSTMLHWFKLAYNRLYWLNAKGIV
jgi:sulfide:quinone oxidoreductase